MLQQTKYHPRVVHSLPYYHAVLLVFIHGLEQRLSNAAIADLLNSRCLLSPSGKPWTSVSVKHALFKLRHHQEIPSHLHKALLQLAFDGVLKPSQSLVLFAPRTPDETL